MLWLPRQNKRELSGVKALNMIGHQTSLEGQPCCKCTYYKLLQCVWHIFTLHLKIGWIDFFWHFSLCVSWWAVLFWKQIWCRRPWPRESSGRQGEVQCTRGYPFADLAVVPCVFCLICCIPFVLQCARLPWHATSKSSDCMAAALSLAYFRTFQDSVKSWTLVRDEEKPCLHTFWYEVSRCFECSTFQFQDFRISRGASRTARTLFGAAVTGKSFLSFVAEENR